MMAVGTVAVIVVIVVMVVVMPVTICLRGCQEVALGTIFVRLLTCISKTNQTISMTIAEWSVCGLPTQGAVVIAGKAASVCGDKL